MAFAEAPMTLYYPKDSELKAAVDKLVSNTRAFIGKSHAPIPDVHEAYTYYVLTLLMYALGLRPTVDPLGMIRHISVETGYCLICDKVSNPNRAFRLVKLPPFVHQQLQIYMKYLEVLQSKLAASSRGVRLAKAIEKMLAGKKQKIPLFFLLNRGASQALSIRPGMIETHLESTLGLPANFGRHVLATEIGSTDCPYHYLEAVLGHCDHTEHAFGKTSLMAPGRALNRFADYTGNVLQAHGFAVLESPYSWSTSEPVHRSTYPGRIFNADQIAHSFRARKREKVADLHRRIAKKVTDDLTDAVRHTHRIDEEQINSSVERIARLCERLGASIRWALKHFYGWLSQMRRKGILVATRRIFIAQKEASPFAEDTLLRYDEARLIRVSFQGLLSEYTTDYVKKGQELAEVDIACFAVISAALMGNMADEQQLRELFADGNHTMIEGGQLLLWGAFSHKAGRSRDDEDQEVDQIWVSDESTAVWLARVYADGIHRRLDLGDFDKALLGHCKSLGLHGRKNPYKWLATQSANLMLIEHMGLVRELEQGRLPTRSLSRAVFARLVDQEPLQGLELDDDDLIDALTSGEGIAANDGEALSIGQYLTFRRWFNRECTHIAKGCPTSFDPGEAAAGYRAKYRVSTGTRKARLELLCERRKSQRVVDVEKIPPVDRNLESVLTYTARLCTAGTQYKKHLAWATVRQYSAIVLRGLTRVAAGRDVTRLDETEYEELYMLMLERAAPRNRKRTLVALREYHLSLMESYRAPWVDWSYIVGLSEWDLSDAVHSIDANYVFSNEYEYALQVIDKQQSLSLPVRTRLKALLILGYRFGLRWSEALYLTQRDLHFMRDGMGVKVRIRQNKYRTLKTRSARRAVPLLGNLSEGELQALLDVKAYASASREVSPKGLLFDSGAGQEAVADRHLLSALANRALRIATGDRSVRFHHLRHSFASSLVALAMGPVAGEQGVWSVVRGRLLEPLRLELPSEMHTTGATEGKSMRLRCQSASALSDILWQSSEVGPDRMRVVSILMGHASSYTTLLHYTHVMPFLSRSIQYAASPGAGLSPMTASAALGQSYDSLRRRLSRNRTTDTLLPLEKVVSKQQRDRLDRRIALTGPTDRRLIEIDTVGPTPITSLDTLSVNLSSHSLKAEAAESLGMLLGLDMKLFHRCGLEAERVTGFDRYAFLSTHESEEGFLVPNTKSARVTQAENTRVRKLLPQMEARIRRLDPEAQDRLKSAIAMLAHATEVSDSLFVIGPTGDVADIEWVLRALGLSDRGLERVSIGPDSEYRRARMARENSLSWRKARRAYSISGGTPKNLVTHLTLLRMVFMAYLYLEYNTDRETLAA
jgi:integrase